VEMAERGRRVSHPCVEDVENSRVGDARDRKSEAGARELVGGEDRVCVVSAGGLVVTSAVKRELGARACWISRTGRVGEC